MSDELKRAKRREWFTRYLADCKGLQRLRQLTRFARGSWDEITLLNKRLRDLSQIFHRIRDIDRQFPVGDNIEKAKQNRLAMAALRREYGYPNGYVLRSEEAERRELQCALSEYYVRWFGDEPRGIGPNLPLSADACRDLRRQFCAVSRRLAEVTRDIENTKWQISRQVWRLQRLRCGPWPAGVRPPPQHERWCQEVYARIKTLQARQPQLETTRETLEEQYETLGPRYVTRCLEYPACGDAPGTSQIPAGGTTVASRRKS
jgi:hypothetical protein